MIPFGMAFFTLSGACMAAETEYRILDLSVMGFTFRLPGACPAAEKAMLHLYDLKTERYISLPLDGFHIEKETACQDWTEYRLEVPSPLPGLKEWMVEYALFTRLKEEDDDRETARRFAFAAPVPAAVPSPLPDTLPLGLALETPALQQKWLRSGEAGFLEEFSEKFRFPSLLPGPLTPEKIRRMHLGNEFCPDLMPDEDLWPRLIDRTLSSGRVPVIVLPPLSARYQEKTCRLVCGLCALAGDRPAEVTVNDWGTLLLLASSLPENGSLTLGVLFNRRKKDPRVSCLRSRPEREGSVNGAEMLHYLAHHRVTAAALEAAPGGAMLPEELKAELHLPYYQMNTGLFCLLRAARENDLPRECGSRTCPRYCEKDNFVYPEAPFLTARFNSLFGCSGQAELNGLRASPEASFPADRAVLHL